MAQYMLLLHQVPNYNADLPREKMLEITKRYMAWADALRQKGRMVGGEKLAAGGVRQIEAKDTAEAESIARDCPHLAVSGTNWVEIRPIDAMPAQARAAAG